MSEMQKLIGEAFRAISAIPVTGEAVEMMALAKERLRQAYSLAEQNGEEGTDNG